MTEPNATLFMGDMDPSGFEALFRENYSFLCEAAYHMVQDEEAAKDIVQDFFLWCWNKRQSVSIKSDFKSYSFRAIKNASLNYKRHAGKVSFREELFTDKAEDENAREQADADEVRNKALWDAVNQLPEQRRLIFLLSNRDGLKYKEIADQLGISINTVKTQIRLAYVFLREKCHWLTVVIWLLITFLKIINNGFTLFHHPAAY